MRYPALKSLAMFDCAARQLNFRIAAEELHLTQGAVAQQVRKLEAELGVKLFRRLARGLELTEAGRQYHISIRQALSLIQNATDQLRPDETTITISVTPSFAAKWLVKKLAVFNKQHPDIRVSTRASDKLADFESENVDIAIRQGQPPFGKNIRFKLLAPEELIAVCHPDYWNDSQPIKNVRDFLSFELIEDSHLQWKKLFGVDTSQENLRLHYFSQTSLAIEAAISQQGIAIVPKLLAIDDMSRGNLINVWQLAQDDKGYYLVHPDVGTAKDEARSVVIGWLINETGA